MQPPRAAASDRSPASPPGRLVRAGDGRAARRGASVADGVTGLDVSEEKGAGCRALGSPGRG